MARLSLKTAQTRKARRWIHFKTSTLSLRLRNFWNTNSKSKFWLWLFTLHFNFFLHRSRRHSCCFRNGYFSSGGQNAVCTPHASADAIPFLCKNMYTLPTSLDQTGDLYLSMSDRCRNVHNYFRCLHGAKTYYGGDSVGDFALLATNNFMTKTSKDYSTSLCWKK